jgi:transposase
MVTPVHLEAADRIAELEADNARLREEVDALENIVRWLIDGLIRIRLGREAIFSDLKNLYSNDPLP